MAPRNNGISMPRMDRGPAASLDHRPRPGPGFSRWWMAAAEIVLEPVAVPSTEDVTEQTPRTSIASCESPRMKPVRRDPPWSGPPCRGAPTSPRSARWTTRHQGLSGGEAPATLAEELCTEAPGSVAKWPARRIGCWRLSYVTGWGLRASRPGPTVGSGRRSCGRRRPPGRDNGRRSSTGVRGSGYAPPIRCDRQVAVPRRWWAVDGSQSPILVAGVAHGPASWASPGVSSRDREATTPRPSEHGGRARWRDALSDAPARRVRTPDGSAGSVARRPLGSNPEHHICGRAVGRARLSARLR